jgi:hypothetical protein
LRTSIEVEKDLWRIVEYYSEVEEAGIDLIRTKGQVPGPQELAAFQLFRAFIRQAKSYYAGAAVLH